MITKDKKCCKAVCVHEQIALANCECLLYLRKVCIIMERILEQTLLYDFYGELLTDHQKQIYQDVVFNDYSYSEVAEIQGISRQGVHDLIRRCDKILTGYEQKLHLVERFMKMKAMAEQMNQLTKTYIRTRQEALLSEMEEVSEQILRQV